MREPVTIYTGDVLAGLAQIPDRSVHMCVTSPPYYALRDYAHDGQIGREETPERYIEKMVAVFAEVRRVLRDDGTFWLNIGDSGRTDRPKDLCMIPWRIALAMQAEGWYIRSVIVWAKRSPMPESVEDRPTSAWEPIFLMSKRAHYYYDAEAVKEPLATGDNGSSFTSDRKLGIHPNIGTNRMPPIGGVKHAGSNGNPTYSGNTPDYPDGRNLRNVWTLSAEPYKGGHFAAFPSEIPRRAIKAGTSERGCCPACGACWTRITKREQIKRERPNDYTKRDGEEGTGNSCANSVAGVSVQTLGWEPGCKCDAGEPVPCVVLDPFLGSGTTIAAARQLGRHGVGCELNPEYVEMARERIGKAEKPNTYASDRAEDAPLFTTNP